MNFLSHHAVARRAGQSAQPAFFVGNVLPDLLSMGASKGGPGRLRLRHVDETAHFADDDVDELARGARLHFATDRRFHAHPLFQQADAEAQRLLRTAPFLTPPPRRFFLGHLCVEVGLDALLLADDLGLADDLYRRFASADLAGLADRAQRLMAAYSDDVPDALRVEASLTRFARSRFLSDYATMEGTIEAVHRVCLRAGLPGFHHPDDRAALGEALEALLPYLRAVMEPLLTPPEPALWYNGGAQ